MHLRQVVLVLYYSFLLSNLLFCQLSFVLSSFFFSFLLLLHFTSSLTYIQFFSLDFSHPFGGTPFLPGVLGSAPRRWFAELKCLLSTEIIEHVCHKDLFIKVGSLCPEWRTIPQSQFFPFVAFLRGVFSMLFLTLVPILSP